MTLPPTVRQLAITFSAIIMICTMSGCSVPFPVYSVSGKNVATIRSIPKTIQVGQFLGDQKSVSCRLQPISPEGGGTFASYIRNAFNDEMIIAAGGASEGKIELKGTLKNIDVDCGIVSASWTIEMELSVGTQPPFTVKTVRSFDGNYFGNVVVTRAYTAFIPTVQDFVNDVLTSPSFQAAVGGQR